MSSGEYKETECATKASTGRANIFIASSAPVYWPAEDGPFVHVPDPLTAH